MTKSQKLSALTLTELYEEKKKRKNILSIIGITTIIVCGILIFFAAKNQKNNLYIVAICSIGPMMTGIAYLGEAEKEIKNRANK